MEQKKRERRPSTRVIWDEDWEVLPEGRWGSMDSLWRSRGVAVIRESYTKKSGRPPRFRISVWAGDLGGYGAYPDGEFDSEEVALHAAREAVAEMKKPRPKYFDTDGNT